MIVNLLHIFRRTGADKITIFDTKEDMLCIRIEKSASLSLEESHRIERSSETWLTKTLIDDIKTLNDEAKVETRIAGILMEGWGR